MVDESGVETASDLAVGTFTTSSGGSRLRHFYGTANVKHPAFGVVAVQFETDEFVDTPGSVEKWEADYRAFVERCVASIEEAARTA